MADTIANGGAEGVFWASPPARLETSRIRAGSVLVFAPEDFRHVDEFNGNRHVERVKDRGHQIDPCGGNARADIENARSLWVGGKVKRGIHGILHIEKISFLFAVAII